MKRRSAQLCAALLSLGILSGCAGGEKENAGGGTFAMQDFSYSVSDTLRIETSTALTYEFMEMRNLKKELQIEVTDYGRQYAAAAAFGEFLVRRYEENCYEDIEESLEERGEFQLYRIRAVEKLGKKSIFHQMTVVGCQGSILQIEARFPEEEEALFQEEMDGILNSLSFTGTPLTEESYECEAFSMQIGSSWYLSASGETSFVLEDSMAENSCDEITALEFQLTGETISPKEAAEKAAAGMEGASCKAAEFLGEKAYCISTQEKVDTHDMCVETYFLEKNSTLCRFDLYYCTDAQEKAEAALSELAFQ